MRSALGSILAHISRELPFEKGRWRVGHTAYKLLETGRAGRQHRQIQTRHGFAMRLDLQEFVDRTIYATGEWEPIETLLTKRLLKPGDTFVDVGANVGYFTLLASRLVGSEGRVVSIEANPATYARLAENIEINACGNVEALNCAVGEADGEAVVVRNEPGNMGGDSVDFSPTAQDRTAQDRTAQDRTARVQVRRLDDILRDARRLTLIKIDIEGAEAMAVRGGRAVLGEPHAPDIILEYTPKHLSRMGDDPAAFLATIRDLGYTIFTVRAGKVIPFEAASFVTDQAYLLCSKKPCIDRI